MALTLLNKFLPFFYLILIGFLVKKAFNVDRKTLGKILIYTLAPVIIFNAAYKSGISKEIFSSQIVLLIICSIIAISVYFFAKLFYKDMRPNMLAISVAQSNAGYFGIPVANLLFNEQQLSMYISSLLGLTIFEATLGYFFLARGKHSFIESIKRLFKLPFLYAFLFGYLIKYLNIALGDNYDFIYTNSKGAYTILGLMMIGINLGEISKLLIDWGFSLLSLLTKFLVWPALILLVIWVDSFTIGIFSEYMKVNMILLSLMPLPLNPIILASDLSIDPEKITIAVLISTLLALFVIPIFLPILTTIIS